MKTLLFLLLGALGASLLSGCGKSIAADHSAAEPVPAASFKAGHGVQFTATARRFAGLATAEVGLHAFAGREAVPAVPLEALVRTVRGDYVYVANGDWFLRTPVSTGASDATHIEIRDGLYEGDTVVVRGARALALAEIQALNGGVGCADGH